MLDMSLDCYDAEDSNLNAVCFGHKKKLTYSGGKCKTMAVNAKKKDMFIEGEEMKRVTSFKYLGDIFQSNGSNDAMMRNDTRGTKILTQMEALMAESQFGKHMSPSVQYLVQFPSLSKPYRNRRLQAPNPPSTSICLALPASKQRRTNNTLER